MNPSHTLDQSRFRQYAYGLRVWLIGGLLGLFAIATVTIALLVFWGIPFTGFGGWQDSLQSQVFRQLNAIADLKKERLAHWLEERRVDMHVISQDPVFFEHLKGTMHARKQLTGQGLGKPELLLRLKQHPDYRIIQRHLDLLKDSYPDYESIALVDLSTERAVISTDSKEFDINFNLKALFRHYDAVQDEFLDNTWRGAHHSPYSILAIARIIRHEGQAVAVLVFHITNQQFFASVREAGRDLGATGEVLLVANDARLLTSLRYLLPSGEQAKPLETVLQFQAAKLAAQGREGMLSSLDYRGAPVLAAYRYLPVTEQWGLGIVVKQDRSESLAAVNQGLIYTAWLTLLAFALIAIFWVFFLRRVAHPVKVLTKAAQLMAAGDYGVRSNIAGHNEFGTLSSVLDTMAGKIEQSQDILERQVIARTAELEHALFARASSDNRMRMVLAGASLGYWDWNFKTGEYHVNDRWLGMLGLERSELSRRIKDVAARMHPDDRQQATRIIYDHARTKTPYTLEFRLRHQDGHWVWIRDSGAVVETDPVTGEPLRLCGVHQDISDYKDIELRHAAKSEILEKSLNEVYIFDEQTLKFIEVNSGAVRNTGYSREEFLELTPLDIKPNYTVAQFNELLAPLRNAEVELVQFSTVHRRKNGSLYPVYIVLELVNYLDIRVFVAVIVDTTEQQRAEQVIRQSQKLEAVGHLAGGLAHDFNNILGIIQGNLDILKRSVDPGTDAQLRIDTALKNVDRGAQLTHRMLSFSRPTAIKTSRVCINDVVVELENLLKKSLTQRFSVITGLAQELWLCELNESELQNVLVNLALNARDAMPEGGTIRIDTSNVLLDESFIRSNPNIKPGNYVLLRFNDNGSGMSAAIQEHVLEPFFTTKAKEKGTGLGLSMVYGFMQRSSGYIKIYSEEGIGTTIFLYFPAVLSPSKTPIITEQHEPAATDTWRGSETVLVVEDEPDLLELTVIVLEKLGYNVLTADSAAQAMTVLDRCSQRVDLLFSDVVMPGGMDGFALAAVVRAQQPGIRVLLTSGFTGNELLPDGSATSGWPILNKPYSQQELAKNIREILDVQYQ